MALSLALSAALVRTPRVAAGARLLLIVLRGSFHGNATRAAFSASAVFRAHPQARVLSEFDAVYLEPEASAEDISAAFALHDRGAAVCLAALYEPQQHFSAYASPSADALAHLRAEAAARGVPLIADEIWSGVHRTGPFLAAPSPPDMVVLGKGLSAGLCKHAAVLVRRATLYAAAAGDATGRQNSIGPSGAAADAAAKTAAANAASNAAAVETQLLVPRPVVPCTLCCSATLACLDATSPSDFERRSAMLGACFAAHGAADSSLLLPVRGLKPLPDLHRLSSPAPGPHSRLSTCVTAGARPRVLV